MGVGAGLWYNDAVRAGDRTTCTAECAMFLCVYAEMTEDSFAAGVLPDRTCQLLTSKEAQKGCWAGGPAREQLWDLQGSMTHVDAGFQL